MQATLSWLIELHSGRVQPSGAAFAPHYQRSWFIPILRDEEKRWLRVVKEFSSIQQVVNSNIKIEPRSTDSKYRVTLFFFLINLFI